jgi:inner membrane protein
MVRRRFGRTIPHRSGAKSGADHFAAVVAGLAASVLTKLPDLLEPATSPHHRQFFHSIAFAALLVATLYKLHQWDAHEPADKLWKGLGMITIAGYLTHLGLDATTTKSLPLARQVLGVRQWPTPESPAS